MAIHYQTEPRRAYIAGPMRGHERWNFDAFDRVTAEFRDMGWTIFSPAEHDVEEGLDPNDYPNLPPDFSLEKCLRWDLARIAEDVDAVIFLPGWEKSEGALKELRVAQDCGRELLEYVGYQRCRALTIGHMGHAVGDFGTNDITAKRSFHRRDPEVRVVDPKSGASKGSKLARHDLIPPDVITELAEHYGRGCAKYAARNWEGGYDWSLSYAAAQRHLHQFWAGEDFDDETGSSHLIAAMWHCAALRWFQLHGKGQDDRSRKV